MGRGGGNVEGGAEGVRMEDIREWVLNDGGCRKRMFSLNNLFIIFSLFFSFIPFPFITVNFAIQTPCDAYSSQEIVPTREEDGPPMYERKRRMRRLMMKRLLRNKEKIDQTPCDAYRSVPTSEEDGLISIKE